MQRTFTLGVCAMENKVESFPMRSILKLLEDSGDFEIIVFPEKMILEEPPSKWPIVECLIAFYSIKFPLEKAIEYVKMFNPIFLNDLEKQMIIRSRVAIYRELQACRIPHPNYIMVDHDLVRKGVHKFEEHYDYIVYNNVRLNKPFIEKSVDSDDHNNWIYYPSNAGGGCKKLFRKIHDRSSEYCPDLHNVRRNAAYIYEEFMSTFGTDIKVYAVGPMFAHAEARKSPALDGKVDRYDDGKEVRYPVILTSKEKTIAYRIVDHFGQTVCGFDILRTFDGPYVCDVNGWSFVKRNRKYHIDCSQIIRIILLLKLQAKYNIIIDNVIKKKSVKDDVIKKTFADSVGKDMQSKSHEELCSVVVVMRHADRKPKSKLKFYSKNKHILKYFKGRETDSQIKLKSPEELNQLNQVNDNIILELENDIDKFNAIHPNLNGSSSEELTRLINELDCHRELKKMLNKRYEFSGINRKVQLKPVYKLRRKNSSSKNATNPSFSSSNLSESNEWNCQKREENYISDSCSKSSRYNSDTDSHLFSTSRSNYGPNPSILSPHEISHDSKDSQSEHKTKTHSNNKSPKSYGDYQKRDTKSGVNSSDPGASKNNGGTTKKRDKSSNEIDSVLVIAKWGGDLTYIGKLQSEDLGRRLRQTLYPADSSGLIRLHSTFRHDFKIFSSDEGRCQITSAAFTKGILDLDGELTPILVAMTIRNKKAYELLNDTVVVKERSSCKDMLNELITTFGTEKYDKVLKTIPEYDRYYYNKAIADSEFKREDFIVLSNLIREYIKCLKKEGMMWNSLYSVDDYAFYIVNKLNSTQNRWNRLLEKFHKTASPSINKNYKMLNGGNGSKERLSEKKEDKDKFDYTKLSDIVDNIRYDLIHLHYLLGHGLEIGFEIYNIVERLSSVISPCEYGVTPREKLQIGAKISWNLLKKVLHDVNFHRLYNAPKENREEQHSNTSNTPKSVSEMNTELHDVKNEAVDNQQSTSDDNSSDSVFNNFDEIHNMLKNDTSAASIAATSLVVSNTYLDSSKLFDDGKCFIGGIKPTEMYSFNSTTYTEHLWSKIKGEQKNAKDLNLLNSYSMWNHSQSDSIHSGINNSIGYYDIDSKNGKNGKKHLIGDEKPQYDTDLLRLEVNEAVKLGIRSPHRMIRSRYYVTSASHLFSLFNFFKYAHLLDDSFDTNSKQIESINDLHYLSHIVLRVWRSKKSEGFFNRLEILVSSGAKDGFGQNFQLLEKNAKEQKNKYKRHIQRYKLQKALSHNCSKCPINLTKISLTKPYTKDPLDHIITDFDYYLRRKSYSLDSDFKKNVNKTPNILDHYHLMVENINDRKFKCYNCFISQYRSIHNLMLSASTFNLSDVDPKNFYKDDKYLGYKSTYGMSKENYRDKGPPTFEGPKEVLLGETPVLNEGNPYANDEVPPYCELNSLVVMNRNFGLDRLKSYIQKAYDQIIIN